MNERNSDCSAACDWENVDDGQLLRGNCVLTEPCGVERRYEPFIEAAIEN